MDNLQFEALRKLYLKRRNPVQLTYQESETLCGTDHHRGNRSIFG